MKNKSAWACYPAMLLMEMLLDKEPLLNGMMVGFFRGGGGAGRDPWSSGSKKVDQGRSRADAAKHQQQQTKNMNLFVASAKSTNKQNTARNFFQNLPSTLHLRSSTVSWHKTRKKSFSNFPGNFFYSSLEVRKFWNFEADKCGHVMTWNLNMPL